MPFRGKTTKNQSIFSDSNKVKECTFPNLSKSFTNIPRIVTYQSRLQPHMQAKTGNKNRW